MKKPLFSRRFTYIVFIALVVSFWLKLYVGLGCYRVLGTSMYPTLEDGGVVVLVWGPGAPDRLDIAHILVKDKYTGETKRWTKRIIGVPGDRIEINEVVGTLRVNGNPVDEPYVVYPSREFRINRVLGEDEYWIMGDNRADSYDSRMIGPVKREQIENTYECWFKF